MSEAETKLRKKAEKAGEEDIDQLIEDVKDDPSWFLNEGGADGTFSNMRFDQEFGHLKPEILVFAEECGGVV